MAEIRLDKLKPINVVEQKSVDKILSEIGGAGIPASNPEGRIKRDWAAREAHYTQLSDHNNKQVMLAFATGKNLDFIGATYYRNSDGSPILRKQGESDEDYRAALQNSPEGLTSAGTIKSYNFHSSRAHPLIGSKEIYTHSPAPMEIEVYFINPEGEDPDVNSNIILKHIEPFIPSDIVRVLPATPLEFEINGVVSVSGGVGLSLVKSLGLENLDSYIKSETTIKGVISSSGIDRALTVEGVRIVSLENWNNKICSVSQYPVCKGINLKYEEY